MKSKVVIVLALPFFLGCLKADKVKYESTKVMTWNIWHGGARGSKDDGHPKNVLNAFNTLKVLQQQDPDVVLMQETYCCGMDVAKKAGYKYSWRGSSNLSIHSKYPIVDTLKLFRPFNSHGAVIDIEGRKILVINLWLHYLPDYFSDIKEYSSDSLIQGEGKTRLKEIKAIIAGVDSLEQQLGVPPALREIKAIMAGMDTLPNKERKFDKSAILKEIKTVMAGIDSLEKELGMPVIIGGDFNSGSHLDWVESTKDAHYGKVVQWPVSKFMEDKGYVDSFREVHPDPTKTLEGTWGWQASSIISDRIDYIYYRGKGSLKAKQSKIIKEDPPGGFFNSDHRAVLSEFEWIK